MRVRTRQGYDRALLQVVESAIRAPTDPLVLSDIASAAGFSVDHLNRFFRETMGESIGAFLRRIRLARSAYALSSLGTSVAEASVLAGFSRPEAFSKSFQNAFGMPPRQFAKRVISFHLDCPTRVHWGESGLQSPLLSGIGDWEVLLRFRQDLKVRAIPHIGDFQRIPEAWRSMGEQLPKEVRADPRLTWISVFRSDGMRVENRESMEALLGYIDFPAAPLIAGFKPITVSGGAYAISSHLVGPEQHREAWWFFNRTWVPKSNYRDEQPGFDLYESFPAPWTSLRATIHLRLG
jgi:AraC-like DNA-binding protein/DNA gyrase inhibitor GyrI